MPDPTPCPPADALSAFAVGRTTDADAHAIETHLAGCPRCLSALDRAAAADPLVAAVRAGRPLPDESADRRLADRLRASGPDTPPGQSTGVTAGDVTGTFDPARPAADEETEDAATFLAPPDGPGEIGRLGPYRVLAALGKGGMGLVFRAEDTALQRPVALKVMRPRAAAGTARQRFLAEARAAAQLKHDHVVTVYQVGEDRGVPFIAMELLDGEPLDARLDRAGRLPAAEVCRIGRQAAAALAAAHARGLIHRDVKPANLWLEAPTGRVKVLDFGLARATTADAGVTASGVIVGTPMYMAPEQARGQPLDGRADLFSLGVTLYRAATGRAPFQGPDTVSVLMAIATATPPAPAAVSPDVPSGLSAYIMRLLAKDPDDRPASADLVAFDLGELEQEPDPAPAQAKAPPPRRRWPAAVAAGFFGLLAVLFGVIVVVRDKDGKKVAEVPVPDGGTVEVKPDAAPLPAVPKAGDAPVQIPEPPPLAEWLKGRTAVTVAQDGSGRFKTIQEALNAVRPGQVVKVLDRGTYRERLEVYGRRDVGLVSEHGATLELSGWVNQQELKVGHIVTGADGFRLHGFRIHYPNDEGRIGFRLTNCPGIVLENCYFSCATQVPIKGRLACVVSFDFDETYRSPVPQTIRGNRFGGSLSVYSRSDTTRAIVERNYFTGRFEGTHLTLGGGRGDTVVVRDNVFDDLASHGDVYVSALGLKQLEISNNLLSGRTPIGFLDSISGDRVVIRNNIHIRTYLAYLASGAEKALDVVKRQWRIDHNAYAEPTTDFGWGVPMADVPKGAGDILGPVKVLSDDPAHPDYLRLPANDPRAAGGVGGDWPAYMGPLPPGPAPKNGDWFAAVRARWGDHWPDPTPIPIPEPPPLAEWLKGRKARTVAQDGSGQHKTIQAALDAVRPGEVIRVLDAGPYRETLKATGLSNTGLVSEMGATIELAGWSKDVPDHGHRLIETERFRLSGFRLVFPNGDGECGLAVVAASGFVLENCAVVCGDIDQMRGRMLGAVGFLSYGDRPAEPSVVRECRIGGPVIFNPENLHESLLVTRNHFVGRYRGSHLGCRVVRAKWVAVRGNVFDDDAKMGDILFSRLTDVERVEVSNNTLNSHQPSSFHDVATARGVVIRNNLATRAYTAYLTQGADTTFDAVRPYWVCSHNAYAAGVSRTPGWDVPKTDLPKGPGDTLGSPAFLSDAPAHPDYLRPPAGDPLGTGGAGGAWPAYRGALPPGPAPAGDWFAAVRAKWAGR